jgi:hypothetical protein
VTEQQRIYKARTFVNMLARELEVLETLRGAKNPINSEAAAAAALAFGDDVRILLLDLRDDYRRRKLRETEKKKAAKR